MSPWTILLVLISYFLVLFIIAFITGKKAGNYAFFLGNRKSPWYIVAIGMIGASISGVTFISVPGTVIRDNFAYMEVTLGYLLGYIIIANVLLPLYYRLNLTSIYSYLEKRFGFSSYKTGASIFLISKMIGASARLFLAASVLQYTIFDKWHIPFVFMVILTLLLILLYTFKGGTKTIVWTDTVQAILFILALVWCIFALSKQLNLNAIGLVKAVHCSNLSKTFFWDHFLSERNHFIKQFLSGVFITIVMTGMDQDMMQKNLSCRNIRDAKKNMYWMSITLMPVILLFLTLGVLLVMFAQAKGIPLPEKSDQIFPLIATGGYLSPVIGVVFIIGLIAAAYSSADSALTALTTSFTVDILSTKNMEEKKLQKVRMRVHLMLASVVVLVILLFRLINSEAILNEILRIAGYTYGPLLGIFSFGLLTKWQVKDKWVPYIAISSPLLCYVINMSAKIIFGYHPGFELLILNGGITFFGLFLIRQNRKIGY